MTKLFVVGFIMCCINPCGPARGDTRAERVLDNLCPGKSHLAPMVISAARRYMQHPAHIVALMHVESRCDQFAVSKMGAVGLTQILWRGRAAVGYSLGELFDERTNIEAGARWLSLVETQCGAIHLALGAYNTGKCHLGTRYARRVLRLAK